MTVSYNLDVSSVNSLAFGRLLCKWNGSILKSVRWELLAWVVGYYIVAVVYRYVLSLPAQVWFARVALHLDKKLDYIPLTFMLGFFVTIVIDRWKQVFQNMGFIENSALSVSTLIRGNDNNVRLARRSIVRYLVLSQILVFRDISMRVRRRFPSMQSLIEAGFLFENELKELNETKLKYNKYWTPINWANTLIMRMHIQKYCETPVSLNNVLNNVRDFRMTLEQLCKYDWVPIPIAYPQVVFLAVRVYFVVCIISRQYIITNDVVNESPIDLFFPFMTTLQFVFLVGWMKVAEALLNPLGEDDDDFEGNWVIDKNISTGMAIVDEGHDRCPLLHPDQFSSPTFTPLYSEDSAQNAGALSGSASAVEIVRKEGSKMVHVDTSKLPTPTPEQSNDKQPSFRKRFSISQRLKTYHNEKPEGVVSAYGRSQSVSPSSLSPAVKSQTATCNQSSPLGRPIDEFVLTAIDERLEALEAQVIQDGIVLKMENEMTK